MTTICFVAGKSGGHLIPCLTTAKRYQHQDPSCSILFFTTATQLDKKIMGDQTAIRVIPLALDTIRPKKIWLYPWYGLQFFKACMQSFFIMRKTHIKKIISMGGYVSIPICLMAKLLRIPVELYELNAVPGNTVRFLAPMANRMFLCFPQAQHYFTKQCTTVPYPVRFNPAVLENNKLTLFTALSFDPKIPTVLICGGSQGSHFINTLMQQWISHTQKPVQIIHQTGNEHIADTLRIFYAQANIKAHVFAYDPALENYYALADLIICRAGAGTLFEIIACKKRCITIPLETIANNHQVANALACAQNYPEMITMLRQQDLEKNPLEFFENLSVLLEK